MTGSAKQTSLAATDGPVLILHDTTEFIYEREQPALIGSTKSVNSGRDKAGRVRSHTISGILMHSSLAVATEGLPFGLTAVKFWTRKKFKGTNALKKKIVPEGFVLEHSAISGERVTVSVRAPVGGWPCPACRAVSRHIQRRYWRQVADLPRD